jgi:hypothetical protein
MLAVGNDELNGPIERRVKCDTCDDFFPVKDSEMSQRWNSDTERWEDGEKGVLQFYTCNCGTFLVGIKGQSILK